MNKQTPLIKILFPNLVTVIFVYIVFYTIYQFLNFQSQNMLYNRQDVKQIQQSLASMSTNIYQSYLSKQMQYLVLSANNSLDIQKSIDKLKSNGYEVNQVKSLYLDLYKLSIQASSLFFENRDLEASKILDDVKVYNDRLNILLAEILNSIDKEQEAILNKINVLIFFSSILLLIIVMVNIKYILKLFNIITQQANLVKDRAVILDSIADCIYGVDKDGCCSFINNQALEILGYKKEEILYKNQHLLFHHTKPNGEYYPQELCPISKTLQDKQTRTCEEYFISKSGKYIPIILTVSITSNDRAVVVFRDITHIKEYEKTLEIEVESKTKELKQLNSNLENIVHEEIEKNRHKDVLLQQQSRLAALGEMMGNIAHQWRQPLSAITSSISGLKLKKDFGIIEDIDIDETNNNIIKNAEFLSNTIENFRNFFKNDQIKKQFNIAQTILDSISIVKATYENHFISIETNIDHNIQITGVENLLSQVILNLLTNAKDALISNTIENKSVKIILKYTDENNICIKVCDNGGGIEENIASKIFDPYFTTKHQAQGTGLGLYMSNQIIHNHFNGTIKTYNIKIGDDFGACFEVILPN